MLTFAYVPGASQFPFGGDVSIILPMRSSAGTPWGAQNRAGSRPLSRFTVPLRREALPVFSVRLFPIPLRAPAQRSRTFRRFGLTPCATALSVEGSRLAHRPPRKRRAAAFTPRSETTIGTGLNSSKRDDIQTMDRQVFGLLFCGAMERKTGLSKWPILYRIVAAQFRRFGRTR